MGEAYGSATEFRLICKLVLVQEEVSYEYLVHEGGLVVVYIDKTFLILLFPGLTRVRVLDQIQVEGSVDDVCLLRLLQDFSLGVQLFFVVVLLQQRQTEVERVEQHLVNVVKRSFQMARIQLLDVFLHSDFVRWSQQDVLFHLRVFVIELIYFLTNLQQLLDFLILHKVNVQLMKRQIVHERLQQNILLKHLRNHWI